LDNGVSAPSRRRSGIRDGFVANRCAQWFDGGGDDGRAFRVECAAYSRAASAIAGEREAAPEVGVALLPFELVAELGVSELGIHVGERTLAELLERTRPVLAGEVDEHRLDLVHRRWIVVRHVLEHSADREHL